MLFDFLGVHKFQIPYKDKEEKFAKSTLKLFAFTYNRKQSFCKASLEKVEFSICLLNQHLMFRKFNLTLK